LVHGNDARAFPPLVEDEVFVSSSILKQFEKLFRRRRNGVPEARSGGNRGE